jgi:hypothetical protein
MQLKNHILGAALPAMKADGRVVMDFPGRKLAVYPNTSGHVVLLSEMDGEGAYFEVLPEEVVALIAALQRAGAEALETGRELNAEYQTHLALEKAKGAE